MLFGSATTERQAVCRLYAEQMMRGSQEIKCRLITVSDIITSERLEKVDLLKIDVERAEKEVLDGISNQHWLIIRQVVLEVHDIEGRLDLIRDQLRENGFCNVAVEQTQELFGSLLYSVFASR